MNDAIWDELLRAADGDYELSLYDRENMLSNDSVFFLIQRGFYRLAVETWFVVIQ